MDLSTYALEIYRRFDQEKITYPPDEDFFVEMSIKDCWVKGFTVLDGARYCRLMEHIQAYNNPEWTEEYCLQEMDRLTQKYSKA